MFIIANLIQALAAVLGMILNLYMWVIIARAVISWVNPDPYNPIVRFLYNVTEPVLYRLRRSLPVYAGGIDFSPIIVLIIIYFLQLLLVQSLYDLARSMKYMG
ncbi:MAG: YggT family protein [Candidatus Binatia bacterium]